MSALPMPLDHLVIAVHDLDLAMQRHREVIGPEVVLRVRNGNEA